MKNTLRVAGGLLLALVLLAGLSAMSVSAQGPTSSGTPGANQTPAQAPAAGAGTTFANAANLGGTVNSLAAGGEAWYQFNYDTGNNTPRPTVTVRLLNGANNGLNFEIWSNERVMSDLSNDKPVGRGTPEVVPGCTTTLPDGTTARCTTNDLTWSGAFGAPGTYFVRIVNGIANSNGVMANNGMTSNTATGTNNTTGTTNNTSANNNNNTGGAVFPQLIVSGPGLVQCGGTALNPSTGNQNATQNLNRNQGFALATCENLLTGQLPSNFNAAMNGTSNNGTTNPSGATNQNGTGTNNTTAPASVPSATSTSAAPAATPAASPTP